MGESRPDLDPDLICEVYLTLVFWTQWLHSACEG